MFNYYFQILILWFLLFNYSYFNLFLNHLLTIHLRLYLSLHLSLHLNLVKYQCPENLMNLSQVFNSMLFNYFLLGVKNLYCYLFQLHLYYLNYQYHQRLLLHFVKFQHHLMNYYHYCFQLYFTNYLNQHLLITSFDHHLLKQWWNCLLFCLQSMSVSKCLFLSLHKYY